MLDPVSLGISAVSIGSGLLGSLTGGQRKVDPTLSYVKMGLEMQENAIRQQQMNLDATRRKRDIIRNAQVAMAKSQAIAVGQGAGNSSFAEGARSAISGQTGVDYLGVSQNQEIGNALFAIKGQQAIVDYMMQGQRANANKPNVLGGVSEALFSKQEDLTRLVKFGFGLK